MVIQQYVRARVAQKGITSHVQGVEYEPRAGLRFCLSLRNENLRDWGEKHLSGRRYGKLQEALKAADVIVQACVANGKVDVSKSVFPTRGFVLPAANDAVGKVARQIQEALEEALPVIEEDCRKLHQAGAIGAHRVREINLGKTRMVVTEEPCKGFDLGWFPEPGDVLMALISGARFFNLKIEIFREGFLLSKRTLEGVVDYGDGQGEGGHYGGITRDLLHDAVMQARVRIPETTAALAAASTSN